MATEMTINGTAVQAASDPSTPLLYVLRDEFNLNGAKYGCGLGQCGACTVTVDGEAVLSCLMPLMTVAGRNVLTVEGLGNASDPGPMQRAFIAEQAAQCGYCIPGMMMRAHATLTANPSAEESELRETLQFNLCRCGTHARILRAIRRARDDYRQASSARTEGEVL